ncbi:hypothetical protein GLYMA_11G177401v4 [Glycine max]|nr:hypothetical protein GLYMA_11G177401v4 [Glycine max]KAH1159908.1 hypothetical protein GYH30_031601 [Glycine max]
MKKRWIKSFSSWPKRKIGRNVPSAPCLSKVVADVNTLLAGVDATSATFVGRIGSLDIYARSILLLLELYNWKETKDL